MITVKAALIALSIALIALQGSAGYKLETRYPVPGIGGFDYVTIDSAARRLYLSHGTQVDVVDRYRFGIQARIHEQWTRK